MNIKIAVANALDQAADLITPEGAWVQGFWSVDKNGAQVPADSPYAVCFCAVGAINRVIGIRDGERAVDHPLFLPIREAFENETGFWLMHFNDKKGRTQTEVVSALRRAANLARTGEA